MEEKKAYHPRKDMSGEKIGRWTVIEPAFATKAKSTSSTIGWYKCICDCGTEREIRAPNLRHARDHGGRAQSCGCIRVENNKARALPTEEAIFRRVYNRIRDGAQRSGKSFDLSLDEVRFLITQLCYYCGQDTKTQVWTRRGRTSYMGIDRVDSEEGYTVNNSVPCCWPCNRAKNNFTEDEFLNLIEHIYEHSCKKNIQ